MALDRQSKDNPQIVSDDNMWPRITIVTPCLNQARFLEETIQSVLSQDYPDLEYIIIDGGSTDGSVEIIKKYENSIAYWISEKDQGQVDAINKGMNKASGDIANWLNADDYFCPHALKNLALCWISHERIPSVLCGDGFYLDDCNGKFAKTLVKASEEKMLPMAPPLTGGLQASWFFTRDAWVKVGGLNNKLNYTMDTDLYYRLNLADIPFFSVGSALAVYRQHQDTKTLKGWKSSINYKKKFYYGWLSKVPKSQRFMYKQRIRRAIFGFYKMSINKTDRLPNRFYKIMLAVSHYPESLFQPYQWRQFWDLIQG